MKVSLGVGFALLAIKILAYCLSHSQALLADVAESTVHQLAVGLATYLSYLQCKPADANHPDGHGKFGYVSSGTEGLLVFFTGVFILLSTASHFSHPAHVEAGVAAMVLVSVSLAVNAALGLTLLRQAKKRSSMSLEANGHHVLADSWTSLGALLSLALLKITGLPVFDSIVSAGIGVVILITGARIAWKSFDGLTDGVETRINQVVTDRLRVICAQRGCAARDIRLRHDSVTLWLHASIGMDGKRSLDATHAELTEIEDLMRRDFREIVCHLHPEPLETWTSLQAPQ
jgi:cation diffusion facilitator family transporter